MLPAQPKSNTFRISGGGTCVDLFRSIDWSMHPLGAPETWPSALKIALQILFNSQHPMFIWWGPELYQFYNDAYLPSFGIGKHPRAMGQRGVECWPEIWPIIKPQIDIVMSGQGSTWNENQLVPIFRNGNIEDVYWTYGYSPIIHEDGTIGGTLVVCTETTQQVLATQALKESEERLSLALDVGSIGFWDWNSRSGKIVISQTLMDDWGIDPATFNNTLEECLVRVHPEDRERVWQEIQRSTFDREPYDVEYRVVRPSGEEIYVSAKGRFFLNEKNEPSRLTGITSNITSRRVVELALQNAMARTEAALIAAEQAQQQAEKANQLKSTFLANMSHEIRTPLGAMLGFADLLRDPDLTPSERSNYADILSRNGENLSVIINDILDLSKVEAGFLTLEFTDSYPEQIVRSVVALLEVVARDKGLSLDTTIDPSTPVSIISDATRIKQVLMNLVGNALKFTQAGSVVIQTYGEKDETGRDQLCFKVIDTGIGIPEAQRDIIFETFVQADGTITRRFGGTGLGLTLSRSLALALSGDISLHETMIGKGSTFLFTVVSQPEKKNAKAVAVSASESNETPENQSIVGKKILVVDDSPDNQKLIFKILSGRGAIVDVADNGATGYNKALTGEYELMLMDIQMPEMDGYTAAYELRRRGYRKPIIALTAHAMDEIRQKCLNFGYTDHLTKPINVKQLLSLVAKYTHQPGLSSYH